MMLWLWNLAAYSVQLAVLVGTGAAIMCALRVKAPRACLRFWQCLFVASVMWPGYQLWMNLDSSGERVVGGVLWSVASFAIAGMQVGAAPSDTGWAAIAITLLAAGATIRLAWLAAGLVKLRAIRANSQQACDLEPLSGPLARELGVTADIRFSSAVTCPATIGFRSPIVLLPHDVRKLSAVIQRAVLTHELIHVRRRDWLWALLEELWCAVLWFHPAARALASRLSLARETVVDEATIAHTRDRRAYAAALLEFSTARPRLLGATALIRRRHLEQRVALLAREVSMPRHTLVIRIAVASTITVAIAFATAAYVPISAALQAEAKQVYKPGSGTTLPRVIREVKPRYTPEALQARIQGTVVMSVVVLATGDVGDVSITRSLDAEHGLDQQAIQAARQWTFDPGTREGKPVAVEVAIEMTFTLKK
jgi:TonB family protein